MSKIVVIAIGGNSLIKDKSKISFQDQLKTAAETCDYIIRMINAGYNIVITHGNGPQVGFRLIKSDTTSNILPLVPMDTCGADTQGTIGYMLQQSLYNKFKEKDINKKAVTIVTQVIVDKDDLAFKNPTKPVGPFYYKEKAEELRKEKSWSIIEDSGRGCRRVAPSPIPIEIIDRETIKNLVENGFVTIAVGVGGIPVIEDERGNLKGQEAVIDKDYASSLLARNINADLFVISTAVEKVYLNFNKPNQKELDKITLSEAKKFIKEGHFAPGSMLLKINAAINFLEDGNDGSRKVILTNPENISRAIQGETGTRIIKD